ncbi:MAG: hypothetical protein ACYC2T_08940 [Bacillota bacterium]
MKKAYCGVGLFLLIIITGVLFLGHSGFDISIENLTNVKVSGLTITYRYIKKDIELPTIQAYDVYKININPKEKFVDGENEMKLNYFDKAGNIHSLIIVGYFESGYYGRVKIKILSVDKNGMITFDVKMKYS